MSYILMHVDEAETNEVDAVVEKLKKFKSENGIDNLQLGLRDSEEIIVDEIRCSIITRVLKCRDVLRSLDVALAKKLDELAGLRPSGLYGDKLRERAEALARAYRSCGPEQSEATAEDIPSGASATPSSSTSPSKSS